MMSNEKEFDCENSFEDDSNISLLDLLLFPSLIQSLFSYDNFDDGDDFYD